MRNVSKEVSIPSSSMATSPRGPLYAGTDGNPGGLVVNQQDGILSKPNTFARLGGTDKLLEVTTLTNSYETST